MIYCYATAFLGFCMMVAGLLSRDGELAQSGFIALCFSGAVAEIKDHIDKVAK